MARRSKPTAQLKSLVCARAAEILGDSQKITLKKGPPEHRPSALTLAELAKAAAEQNLRLETESYHAEHETPPEGVFQPAWRKSRTPGQVILRKLDTIHDVATILNPVGHQGESTAASCKAWVTV